MGRRLHKTLDRPEDDRSRESFATRPGRVAPRTSVVIKRRAALGVAWVVTVTLAAIGGWFVGQRFTPPESQRSVSPVRAANEEPPALWSTPAAEASPLDFGLTAATDGSPEPEPEPLLEEPEPVRIPVKPPPALPEPAPEEVIAEPVEPAPPPAPVIVITEVFERANELAEQGDFEGARAEAEALLAEYRDYSGLIGAFRESGADEMRARLDALRVLQLGDLHLIAVELARELKRSYAGSAEVKRAIEKWRILKPTVTTLDTSIVEGRGVVVQGHVANPDVGVVRRVIVEIEAFDAGGNTLTKTTTRVRPRSLDSGEAGSFAVEFAAVDPASVLRVRATVVKWESEVLE